MKAHQTAVDYVNVTRHLFLSLYMCFLSLYIGFFKYPHKIPANFPPPDVFYFYLGGFFGRRGGVGDGGSRSTKTLLYYVVNVTQAAYECLYTALQLISLYFLATATDCSHPNQFKCKNGQCASRDFVCDGTNDCGDLTDEQDCEHFACPDGELKCSNFLCIESYWKCDGYNDCGNGWDEQGCHTK
ncbi:unnamed protein product [Lymnaea stagnalis]|uniref:Uncharacterized protein n=1 Tax=Lymnaea stagnalis TaxID=6523 RepID=A0AAV2H055_LYMST